MIAGLLVFLLFAVLQVALYFYVRNVVSASAADGARYAANAGVESGAGGVRATSLIRRGLSTGAARDVPCTGSGGVDGPTGISLAVVRCSGHVRSVFVPLGALLAIDVTSRSLKESAS